MPCNTWCDRRTTFRSQVSPSTVGSRMELGLSGFELPIYKRSNNQKSEMGLDTIMMVTSTTLLTYLERYSKLNLRKEAS